MRKLNFLLSIVIAFSICLGGIYLNVYSEESQPQKTLMSFLKEINIGNSERASEFLTNEPAHLNGVVSAKLTKIREKYEFNAQNEGETDLTAKDSHFYDRKVSKTINDDNKQILLESIMRSFNKDLQFKKIVRVTEHENEAKILASFSKEGLADSNYNFLLIKEKGEWKIFLISLDNGTEFDLYEFWATDSHSKSGN